jgi:hypothetical protein
MIMVSPIAIEVSVPDMMTRRERKCMKPSRTAAPPMANIQQMLSLRRIGSCNE